MTLPFKRQEYERREARVLKDMDAAGVDCLLLTEPASIVWLTGYDNWSFYLPQALIVSPKLCQPIWVGRSIDLQAARLTSRLGDTSLFVYGDEYVQQADRHPANFIVDCLRQTVGEPKRLGLELDSYYLTPRYYEATKLALKGVYVVDVSSMLTKARAVKSAVELDVMRDAAKIAEHAMRTALPMIKEGARECDVAAAAVQAQIAGVDKLGGFYTSSPPFLLRGSRGASAHLSWGQDRFKRDETAYLELVGCRHRYQVTLSRAVYLGNPPNYVRRAADASVEAISRACEVAKPGVTCEDVAAEMMTVFDKHAVVKTSRCGYGVGIAYPPTSGERSMTLFKGDKTPLESGMTFHIHPNLVFEDWGIFITDTIVVTPDGGEPFCSLDRELIVR